MPSYAKKVLIAVACLCAVILGYFLTPWGRSMWNKWFHQVQVVDDATSYKTRKHVEDTCRAMIASYESDKRTYEQYKDSEEKEKQEWAEQAKMRANKTASSYNNYILENRYVWKDNIPSDIKTELTYID